MSPLRVVLLGSGKSAQIFHAPYIRELPQLFSLHGVFERGATKEKSRARDAFGSSTKVYTRLEDVLSDSEVDLTVVCVPTGQHFEYAKASLLAGKHVIVEKPFTSTAIEARELIALAKETNLRVFPFQNRRYDSDFLTVQKLLKDGTIPEVIDFESRYDCNASWELGPPGPGQGIVPGLGSHIIDQLVVLFGPPATVYGDCFNGRGQGDPDATDSCNIVLKYADSPRRVIIRICLFSTLVDQPRYLVRGKNVAYVKYGMDPQEEQLMRGMQFSDPGFGDEEERLWGTLCRLTDDDPARPSPYLAAKSEKIKTETGNYIKFYENVSEAIKGEKEQYIKPEHALITTLIIEATHKSSDLGGQTVKLDL